MNLMLNFIRHRLYHRHLMVDLLFKVYAIPTTLLTAEKNVGKSTNPVLNLSIRRNSSPAAGKSTWFASDLNLANTEFKFE